MAEQVFYDHYKQGEPHEFVCAKRASFSLKVNNDVRSGARMIVTDLPLSEADIRKLADKI